MCENSNSIRMVRASFFSLAVSLSSYRGALGPGGGIGCRPAFFGMSPAPQIQQ